MEYLVMSLAGVVIGLLGLGGGRVWSDQNNKKELRDLKDCVVQKSECELKHSGLDQLLTEQHTNLYKAIGRIEHKLDTMNGKPH